MSDLESMSMEVDMILADQSAASEANRNYAAFQLSLDCAKNELLTDEDQRATYYLGGICCLMPDVTNNIIEAVRSTGQRVRTIYFPSAAARNGLIFPPKNVEPEKVMALFGYLVIMLYMNVDVFNFIEYSKKRFKALCNALGFSVGEGEDVAVFSDVKHWFYLRTTYGFNHEIRKAILNGILNLTKDKDSFGGVVCSYLAEILKFTDMTGICFTTLTLSASPLLALPELADEVENLRRAIRAILNSKLPWYYMILENPGTHFMLDSSNFPMLMAVTRKIGTNAGVWDVDYYVSVHRNQQSHKSASLLAGNGEEEVEVVFKNLICRSRSSCSWSIINI